MVGFSAEEKASREPWIHFKSNFTYAWVFSSNEWHTKHSCFPRIPNSKAVPVFQGATTPETLHSPTPAASVLSFCGHLVTQGLLLPRKQDLAVCSEKRDLKTMMWGFCGASFKNRLLWSFAGRIDCPLAFLFESRVAETIWITWFYQ